jgi:hypothetical protein
MLKFNTMIAESTSKQFSTNELRTMVDGMNNGLFYNRQGQVTTQESGDVLYTLKELQDLQTQYQAEGKNVKLLMYLFYLPLSS